MDWIIGLEKLSLLKYHGMKTVSSVLDQIG